MIYEQGDSNGDGAATQNRRRFDGFDFAIDEPGFTAIDWRHLIVETNRRVTLGRGTVTNVFGWRTVEHDSLVDIDGTVGGGDELSMRASLAHRDDSEITDNNLGVLDGGDLVDLSIDYSPSGSLTFTLYGRNLLNEVLRRSDFDLTGLVNSTYSPLKEGRVLGIRIQGRL